MFADVVINLAWFKTKLHALDDFLSLNVLLMASVRCEQKEFRPG